PLRIIEEAGYDNYLLEREDGDDTKERVIAHVSLFVSCHYPVDLLPKIADDIVTQLEDEEEDRQPQPETAGEAKATTAPVHTATAAGISRRRSSTVGGEARWRYTGEQLVELRRRRRQISAGHYVL
ncbi:hypothetical protein PHMEG_00038948, partial [Phytophthora megakarya]